MVTARCLPRFSSQHEVALVRLQARVLARSPYCGKRVRIRTLIFIASTRSFGAAAFAAARLACTGRVLRRIHVRLTERSELTAGTQQIDVGDVRGASREPGIA